MLIHSTVPFTLPLGKNALVLCLRPLQKQVEEVDIVLPGRNYLWHNNEGNVTYRKAGPHGSPVVAAGIQAGPVFQYLHHCSSKYRIECLDAPYAAVIGGVVYRAARNPCLQVSAGSCLSAIMLYVCCSTLSVLKCSLIVLHRFSEANLGPHF